MIPLSQKPRLQMRFFFYWSDVVACHFDETNKLAINPTVVAAEKVLKDMHEHLQSVEKGWDDWTSSEVVGLLKKIHTDQQIIKEIASVQDRYEDFDSAIRL